MVVVCGILVAHFVDKCANTFKTESHESNLTLWYIALVFKICFAVIVVFAFARIRQIINEDPFLALNDAVFNVHALCLTLYFIGWLMYEVT